MEAVPAAHDPTEGLTALEWAALFSNLARGCEKQYMPKEADLFAKLADACAAGAEPVKNASLDKLLAEVEQDLAAAFPRAKATAEAQGDRGAQRALVWSEKVTRIQRSLLSRHQKLGDSMLEGKNVYVCTICGFISVGAAPPPFCPVCKAPDWKFVKAEGR